LSTWTGTHPEVVAAAIVVAPEIASGHPAQVVTALDAAAQRRARGILANRLRAAVVVPEPCPRALEPGPVLAAHLGAAFGENTPAAAAELAAAAAAALAALRPRDLRAGPFVTMSVTSALAALAEVPGPLGPGELGTEQAMALAALEGAARRASRAAGCRALRRRRLNGARRELAGALGALQARLVPLLARQVAALAAEQLARQLSERLAAMEAARERVLALCEARHDPRPAGGLLPGPGGHRFSLGPSEEAVFGAAASREPALIAPDGSARPGIWAAFGAWLARNEPGAMEEPDAAPGALEAFLDDLAGRALEGFGLSGLYEAAGVPFDVAMWSSAATPRVALGAGVASAYDLAVAEVPADLSAAQRQALSARFRLRTSEGADRVVVMRAWHGFSAEDLLRAERAPLPEVLEAASDTASCPAARRELARWAASRALPIDGAQRGGQVITVPFRDGGALRHRSPGQHEAPAESEHCHERSPRGRPGLGQPRREGRHTERARPPDRQCSRGRAGAAVAHRRCPEAPAASGRARPKALAHDARPGHGRPTGPAHGAPAAHARTEADQPRPRATGQLPAARSRVAATGTRPRGRPRKLSAHEELRLAELYSSGQARAVELAVLFGVGRSTVYRALQRAAGARHAARSARLVC
jgi:hypothetical protein